MLPGGPTRFRCAHRLTPFPQPGRATAIIPAVRLAEEAPRLRPLRVRPEELALRIPVYVGPTGTVQYDGHAYSMPPETAFPSSRDTCNSLVSIVST